MRTLLGISVAAVIAAFVWSNLPLHARPVDAASTNCGLRAPAISGSITPTRTRPQEMVTGARAPKPTGEPMSALGQKQTFALQLGMSDMDQQPRRLSCARFFADPNTAAEFAADH